MQKIKTDWTGTVLVWGGVIIAIYFLSNLFGSNYVAYKCNYKSALFSSDAQTTKVLKEFGGDPCEKEGKNRFKSFYSKEFDSKSSCESYINTTSQSTLKAPSSNFVLGCEKK